MEDHRTHVSHCDLWISLSPTIQLQLGRLILLIKLVLHISACPHLSEVLLRQRWSCLVPDGILQDVLGQQLCEVVICITGSIV